jgi:DNA-directed RNA polymerase delta subunit
VYQIAKALSHTTKGNFSLERLFNEIVDSIKLDKEEIAEIIFELVQNKVLLTVSLEKRKKKFIIHF